MEHGTAASYAAIPAIPEAFRVRVKRRPLLMWGAMCVCTGLAMHLVGVLMVFPRYLLGLNQALMPLNEWVVWYSGIPIMTGFAMWWFGSIVTSNPEGDLNFWPIIASRTASTSVVPACSTACAHMWNRI